ncbi:uncharacterized protein LOC129607673 [Condylostylus longicornis]|uniref:uncharacterized protein LOC129607673 n=1 Tax=Condylostylus longicornis TaxID=2530218 RepID=UPI00244E34FC|nr:uncharacterized protein LOC129607673 [Condylostylus longicornis]
MASSWDKKSIDVLLNYLKDNEHIYNRLHPMYKTYNVITECSHLAKMFDPPKNCKEVLDKITSIKNFLAKNKNLLEEGNMIIEDPQFFNKCSFMFSALFGYSIGTSLKRKSGNSDNLKEKNKKPKMEDVCTTKKQQQKGLKGSDKVTNTLSRNLRSNNITETKRDDQKIVDELERKEFIDVINFIRYRPYLWDKKHPAFSENINDKVLENFGNSLNPPLTATLIKRRILALKKRYLEESKSKRAKWHLFKECGFFSKDESSYNDPPRNGDEMDRNNDDFYRLILFIKNRPYFYDSKLPKYNSKIKDKILNEFGETFDPPVSISYLKNRIGLAKAELFKFFDGESLTISERFEECETSFKEDDENSLKSDTFDETHPNLESGPEQLENEIYLENSEENIFPQTGYETNDSEESIITVSDSKNVSSSEDDSDDDNESTESYDDTNYMEKHQLLRIIEFIRFRTFLWDSEHPAYQNVNFNKKILKAFGETLIPPMSVDSIQYRIYYLEKMFFKTLEDKNFDWHLKDECNFFLKKESNTSKTESLQIEEKMDENDIHKILQYIKNKPYLYYENHPLYNDSLLKNKTLKSLGESLNTPTSEIDLTNQINYLKQKFLKTLEQNNIPKWKWFKQCKFFIKDNADLNKKFLKSDKKGTQIINTATQNKSAAVCTPQMDTGDIQQPELISKEDSQNLLTTQQKQNKSDSKNSSKFSENVTNSDVCKNENFELNNDTNMHKFLQFLRENPYFYDSKQEKYTHYTQGKKILKDFAKSLDPPLSDAVLKSKIIYLKLKFLKSIKENNNPNWKWFKECEFFIRNDEKLKKKFESIVKAENMNHNNKSQNDLSNEVIVENVGINRDIGIQCNLYEELLEENLKSIKLKECECLKEILDIIKSFNPIDKNFSLEPVTNSDYSNNIEDDTSNLKDEEFLNIDLENVFKGLKDSADDSSDYGLEEIPFPKIVHSRKRTKKDNYKCDECPIICTSKHYLARHKEAFHFQHSLLCSKCGKTFPTHRRAQAHEKRCRVSRDENLFCYLCKQLFLSKIVYEDHFNVIHDKKTPYACGCGRTFSRYSKLVHHLNIFHCNIDLCTIPHYVSKEYLKSFIQGNDVKPIDYQNWCRICKTNSCNRKSYVSHFRKDFHMKAEKKWLEEFGIKTFQCEICEHNKSLFNDIASLVEHCLQIHRKHIHNDFFEKLENISSNKEILIVPPTDLHNIYSTCHICSRKFFMGYFEDHFNEERHIQLGQKWLQKYNIEEIHCNSCFNSFGNLLDYLLHNYSKHNEVPTNSILKNIVGEQSLENPGEKLGKMTYKCLICDSKPLRKGTYIIHMLRHYPEKYIQCSCGEKFHAVPDLKVHQKLSGCVERGSKIPKFKVKI